MSSSSLEFLNKTHTQKDSPPPPQKNGPGEPILFFRATIQVPCCCLSFNERMELECKETLLQHPYLLSGLQAALRVRQDA